MLSGGDGTLRALAAFAALGILVQGCASLKRDAPLMRAMTYNIRLDTDADGANAWPNRRAAVSALLRFYAPDIAGLQEVQLHQLGALKEDLSDYQFVGVGRDDGVEAGEFSSLAFREERFRLIESGQFWLSQTPTLPSRGFDAAFPRLVTWAHLEDRRNGAAILALNTHFDHVGVQARRESARMIRAFVLANRRPCESVLLVGDFNSPPDDEPYRLIVAPGEGALADARALSLQAPFGPQGTFNGFDILRADAAPIDYVFVDRSARVVRHGVITQHDEGRLPSDHYPVMADFEPPKCARP